MNFDTNGPVMKALRFQLAAVKQHITHVLTFQARSDEESAAEIAKIDSVDLLCAMQLVEFLASMRTDFELCDSTAHLPQTLPNPGFTNTEIGLAEQKLEGELGRALLEAKYSLRTSNTPANSLVNWSLELRPDDANWLFAWSRETEPNYVACSSLDEEQSQWLDCLFANMMVMIDQSIVHRFVQLREGNEALADFTWEVSDAAMMQATAITNHLARRGLAAKPKQAISTKLQVVMQSLSSDPVKAIQADKKLAAHCVEIGSTAAHALTGPEFKKVSDRLATYFDAVVNWSGREKLPNIPYPCRDFARTRLLYINPVALNRTA